MNHSLEVIERIAVVETACIHLMNDIKEIRSNDLSHIANDISKMFSRLGDLEILVRSRPSWLTTTIITFLSSALVATIVILVSR
jgi:hypothetical protein